MRSLWSAQAPRALRQTAFALDAAVFDLAYLTGPVVASALAVGVAPAAAVGLLLALTGAAIVMIGRRPSRPARDAETGRRLCPAAGHARSARRPSRVLPGTAGFPGPAAPAHHRGPASTPRSTATEVALTGYVRQHHALWASGPLLAGVSAGSIVGSLLLGARGSGALAGETGRRLPRLLACYALGLAALTAASLYAPLIAVAAPLAGLCLGPSLATLFNLASSASDGASGGASGGAPARRAAAPRRKAG